MDPHASDETRSDDDDHDWVYEGDDGWDEAEWHDHEPGDDDHLGDGDHPEEDPEYVDESEARQRRPRRSGVQRLILVAGVFAVMGCVAGALALGNV